MSSICGYSNPLANDTGYVCHFGPPVALKWAFTAICMYLQENVRVCLAKTLHLSFRIKVRQRAARQP